MINTAIAATSNSPEPSPLGFFIPLILVFAVFYFLVIRPQRQKFKQHTEVLNAIKVGDVVITGGGIVAKVVEAKGDELLAEISKGVEVKLLRRTVAEVMPKPRSPAASNKPATKPAKLGNRP